MLLPFDTARARPPQLTLREIIIDELITAMVIFDLLRYDVLEEEARTLRWIQADVDRIFKEIGDLVEKVGE